MGARPRKRSACAAKNGSPFHLRRRVRDIDQPRTQPLSTVCEYVISDPVAKGRENALAPRSAALELQRETDGKITICEVKLRRNSEVRREVIAQALSYAAFLEGMDVDDFDTRVVQPFLVRRSRSDLLNLPLPTVAAALADSEIDEDEFLSNLETVLAEGNFRILIVVDEVHPQLRKSVAYVNGHASFDLYIVEVAVFRSADGVHEILQPRMLDAGPASRPRSASPRFDRTPEDFVQEAIERDPDAEPAIRQLYEGLVDLQRRGLIQLDTGSGATASLKVQVGGTQKSIVWVWAAGNVTFPRYPLPQIGITDDQVQAWIEKIAMASGAPPSKWGAKRKEPGVVEAGALGAPGVVEVLLVVIAEAAQMAQDAASLPV